MHRAHQQSGIGKKKKMKRRRQKSEENRKKKTKQEKQPKKTEQLKKVPCGIFLARVSLSAGLRRLLRTVSAQSQQLQPQQQSREASAIHTSRS